VANCFFRNQVELPKPVAGLLLAGLVSDTLNLTSPTTTDLDVQVLKHLEEVSGVCAREFTEKLFASGSVLTSLEPTQLITMDCKQFTERGRSFSIAQIEELGFAQFWKRKAELAYALETYRVQKQLFFSALLVTDVVRKTSLLLVAGSRTLLNAIDYPQKEPR